MKSIEIGAMGEEFAADILAEKGYIILRQNFSCRTGEIDIIAKQNETFVFVEVKTRKNTKYGNPSEFVNYGKQKRIISAALQFLKSDDFDMRFDVFEVLYTEKDGEFIPNGYNHIENAF